MSYRYATEQTDYGDFAAGPVLYSLPGRPAFPVRLASEIFQRCQAQLRRAGNAGPYALYDPCCGSAYLLTTLAYLHRPAISAVIGSDVDPEVMPLAGRNLSLLTPAGVKARAAQLAALLREHGRPSHAEALAAAGRLGERLRAHGLPPAPSRAFVADALDPAGLAAHLAPGSVDVVITDIPYGQRTAWRAPELAEQAPEWRLLEALRPLLAPAAVVAITTNKQPKAAHPAYRRLEQLQLGKRRTLFYAPLR